jgi:hypothetical protein
MIISNMAEGRLIAPDILTYLCNFISYPSQFIYVRKSPRAANSEINFSPTYNFFYNILGVAMSLLPYCVA